MHSHPPRRQEGWGLAEILIAATIGLILMGALFTIFTSTQRAFTTQTQLGQLQDTERLTMTMITNVLQTGGYFPDPMIETTTTAFPVSPPFPQTGQFIIGTTGPAVPGDSITVRYVTASGDGIMNCLGLSNTTGANVTYVNVFSVDSQQNLTCSVNGAAPVALVTGVQRMTITYGLDTDGDGTVNQYVTASAITAANWSNVKSMRVTLVFMNPLTGQGQPATVSPFTQVISVRGRT